MQTESDGRRWEHKNVRFEDNTQDHDEFDKKFQAFLDSLSEWQVVTMIRINSGHYRLLLTREIP